MSDKKEKIREIFAAISPERKNNVRRILSTEFNISVDSAKMNWIYGGKIPEQYIDRVLKILQSEVNKQIERLQELVTES